MSPRLAAIATTLLLATQARGADIHIYSYDPVDAATRAASGPLTFTLAKGLLHTTVLNLMSTEVSATAWLRRADQTALGRGGLSALLPPDAAERDLYDVEPRDQGAALVTAFCPGAERGWMAFGPMKFNRDLTVRVLGAGKGQPPRLCRTLSFRFHGEWQAPPGRRIDATDLDRPRFPG